MLFYDSVSMFLYTMVITIIIGANIYMNLLYQWGISIIIFIISYVLGRLIFNKKGRRDWKPMLFSIAMFFILSMWGVVLIEVFNLITNGVLALKLESISNLDMIAYFAIVVLSVKSAQMNIDLEDN